jgi:NAD(P)-dependent dehydrogenase (short-subunit alcohol dehydrogenase family)
VQARQLESKAALITGGGGGLGSAMARLFVARGAAVALADINLKRAQRTADSLTAEGARAIAIQADVTCEDQVRAMVAQAAEALGGLDILVNNAGSADRDGSRGDYKGFANLTGQVWDDANAINARAPMFCCKHAVPEFLKRGGGAIVNIASVAGLKGGHALAAYGASKAALISLTRYVAVAYGKQNIRCNAIAPGATVHERMQARVGAKELEPWNVLTSRLGRPDDIAYAAAFLASDEAGFITGQCLAVDGGGTVGLITAMPDAQEA